MVSVWEFFQALTIFSILGLLCLLFMLWTPVIQTYMPSCLVTNLEIPQDVTIQNLSPPSTPKPITWLQVGALQSLPTAPAPLREGDQGHVPQLPASPHPEPHPTCHQRCHIITPLTAVAESLLTSTEHL